MAKIIGLTGGIASGKSTITKMFKEKDIPVIDADKIVHDLLTPKTETYKKILDEFSDEILFTNDEINRKKLATLIFNNTDKRKKLNSIVHPKVREQIEFEIKRHKLLETEILVLDVPLLYESNLDELCDKVIVVYTTKEKQVNRLIDRDKITKDYALKKINSQMSLEDKKEKADFVIDNSQSILQSKVDFNDILEQLEVK
ncbi:MAG: dephospho-CoA kinase [Candidatus Izimaplasma sp.]|nr:dephospho-CoA kinase [Candidatus Izimaplasma bacterium]